MSYWTSTRYEHLDPISQMTICVFMDGVMWGWTLGKHNARGFVARGREKSSIAAKREATKAFDAENARPK